MWSIKLQPTLYKPVFYGNWIYHKKEYLLVNDFRLACKTEIGIIELKHHNYKKNLSNDGK